MAGSRPANAPMTMAEAMPPAHASTGTTAAQPLELAYTAVEVTPKRRSSTDTTMMLATPMAPTMSATTPRPRKRLSNAPAAAARAVRTSDEMDAVHRPPAR